METLEALLRNSDARGKLQRTTATNMAVTLDELHRRGGVVEDKSGRVVSELYEAVKDNVEMGQTTFGGAFLNKMQDLGIVEVERRGKRTFRVEVVAYPVDVTRWLPMGLRPQPDMETHSESEAPGHSEVIEEDEAEVLGARPGRLAARLEKSIPDLVAQAVTQAVDNKFDQMIRGMGYVLPTEASHNNQYIGVVNALEAALDEAEEKLRVEQILHEYTRQERNRLMAEEGGTIKAGTLQPSQLHKSLQDIAKWAIDNGFTIQHTNGGHIVFKHGNGGMPIYSASTPSDYRGQLNLKADLNRVLREVESS